MTSWIARKCIGIGPRSRIVAIPHERADTVLAVGAWAGDELKIAVIGGTGFMEVMSPLPFARRLHVATAANGICRDSARSCGVTGWWCFRE